MQYKWDAKDGITCYSINGVDTQRPAGCTMQYLRKGEIEFYFHNPELCCSCMRGTCMIDNSVSQGGILSTTNTIEEPVCKRGIHARIRAGYMRQMYRY